MRGSFPDAMGMVGKIAGSAEIHPRASTSMNSFVQRTPLLPNADSVLGVQKKGSKFLALETESWLITKTWVRYSPKLHFAYLESGY